MAHIRALIDAPSMEVSWEGSTPEVVRLTISVVPRTFLPVSLGFGPGERISRTAEVRVEQPVAVTP